MQTVLIGLAIAMALGATASLVAASLAVCVMARAISRAIWVHLANNAVEAGVRAGATKHDGWDAIIEYGLVHALAAEPKAFKALDFDTDVLGRMALAKLANSRRDDRE